MRSAFPAEADIAAVDDARALVLVSRTPASGVAPAHGACIDDLATMDADAPLGLQLSASIGWADVDTVGYDLRALLSAAERHALAAIATAATAGSAPELFTRLNARFSEAPEVRRLQALAWGYVKGASIAPFCAIGEPDISTAR